MMVSNRMFSNFAAMGMFSFLATVSLWASWDPRLAADYLDSRQKAWSEWPHAKATGGTCLSCHTGATYLLARPALRRELGESQPTSYETALLNGLRSRVGLTEAKDMFPAFKAEPLASQYLGVEAVYAALFLAQADAANETLSADAQKAFDRLWSLQLREGPAKGAWSWFSLGLDPYEMPPATFYGAALAALAVGAAPGEYRNRPEVRERIADLNAYLARERESQPLHHRLMLLWASTKLAGVLPDAARKSMIDEIWRKQEADGGWTIQSLGPWNEHPRALASTGSNSYATALVTFVLETQDVTQLDPRLLRARAWLESHQAHQGGYWAADSMNKQYPPGSMEEQFMRDAATAFAAMALTPAFNVHSTK
jgi:squalene-hopene/tetraprenyl-beta-curcumene cyclase